MEKEGFKYYAFISYSHKDKKIAKKLQKRLESYHLPSALQKSYPTLPKKLTPVFIDESNLVAIGSLKTALQANLDRSNYLILICSPNSAKSKYVNDEVDYFIKSGRADHIIPFIVGGKPYAEDTSMECFPPAILALSKEDELLGIDLKKFGVRDSFLRIIATMLELDLDSFISREARERKKKAMIFSPIAAALMIIAGMFAWHNIPHYNYYHSYIYRWEKPVGLFEVKSETDRKKMEYTYRFTTLRGKVQKIERINSAGILIDPSIVTALTELPMIVFVSDGVVEYYDLYGHKIYRKEYTKNMQAVDFYCGDGDVPYALPSDMNDFYNTNKYNPELSFSQKSGNIIRQTLEYDDNGYVVKKMFRSSNHGGKDKKGTPARDEKGRWGFGYTVDDMGRITGVHNLDKDGEAMSVNGIYVWHIDYGNAPYPVKDTYFDNNGNIVTGPIGAAFDTVVYDEYFNVEKLSWFDTNGKPVLNTKQNISEVVFTHNPDNGFITSQNFYGTDLEPCLCKDGYFREELKSNSDGRFIEISFYDIKGEKTICSNGYAGFNIEYNDNGQMISMFAMDIEDNPAIDSSNNVYGYKYSYEDGFIKRVDYLDFNGNLMLNKYGNASATSTYDKEENKIISIIYKDTEGKKVLTSTGCAEVHFTYDDGNISSRIYYDEAGKLVTDNSGVAKYIYEWKDGNLMSEKCFDANDRLTLNSQGYAEVDYEYDDNGLKIWERYYDADGNRIVLPKPNGYSAIKYTYDNKGNNTSMTYYDADDHYAIKTNEHYCCTKNFDYYDTGKIKNIKYIREKNSQYQGMLDKQVEYVCYEYDDYGNETKRYWLNNKGEEVNSKGGSGGSVREENVYDIYGRLVKKFWYKRGEEKAWIIEEREYDSFGRKTATYGVRYADGNKDIMIEKKDYDNYGRCCKTYYLDGENRLIIPKNIFKNVNINYAIEKVRYDIFGNKTDIWYFDENEKPMYRKSHLLEYLGTVLGQKQEQTQNKAFHTVRTYDSKGNIITESYYNDENEDDPIELSGGFHKMVRKYDASGHETERWLYGTDGNLIKKDGIACHTVRRYNALGKLTSIETYDSEGKPFSEIERGAFKTVYAYDSYGNISDTWYFEAGDVPCQHIYKGKVQEHHRKCSYNAMGKILSVECFDVEEKPCLVYSSHKMLYVYNSYGWLSERAYYDEKQNLLRKKLFKYDSEGNKISEEWTE